MATLAAGTVATLYLPIAQTITITPGTGGRVSINGRNIDGSAVTPQEIYTATNLSLRSGATITVEAINVDCTYSDVGDIGLTSGQIAAGATGVAGVTSAGQIVGADGGVISGAAVAGAAVLADTPPVSPGAYPALTQYYIADAVAGVDPGTPVVWIPTNHATLPASKGWRFSFYPSATVV